MRATLRVVISPARKPPPPTVDDMPIAIDRWCPNCGAPAGKRCIDTHKRSRPPATITHIARGWLDRPCRRCGAQPGERCRTPSGRDADPHTPRRFSPNTPDSASRRPARGRTPAPADAPVEYDELALVGDRPLPVATVRPLVMCADARDGLHPRTPSALP
jgi:hypothetical protein